MNNPISLEEFKKIVYEYFKENNFLRMFLSDRAIKNRLDKNIKSLSLEDRNQKMLGTYDILRKKINLYLGNNVTKDDLISNTNISTLVHEAVHAILRTKYGTGMLYIKTIIDENLKKVFNTKEGFPEIGRGLNEGFTNWIVQQSGLDTNTYINLTEIISIIYACIGAEKMIPFKSYNYNRICKSLHMSRDYGMEFIRQVDEIYFAEEKIRDIGDVLQFFEKTEDAIQNDKKDDYEELIKQFEDLQQSSILNAVYTPERQQELEQLLNNKDLAESDLVASFISMITDMKYELDQDDESETLRKN